MEVLNVKEKAIFMHNYNVHKISNRTFDCEFDQIERKIEII